MGVTFIDIEDENDVGQRIDNFLMRRLKGVPKQKIYSILRKGEVRVNSGRVKQTYRLKAQDRVRIPPVATRAEAPVQLNDETEQLLEASILLEDKDFIAINKPYGFAVHGGSSITSGVVEMLRVIRGQPRIELAHRLDRDTSGCLLLCKKRGVLKEVQAAFRERTVKKKYTLIAQGRWPTKTRTIQDRLLRYETDWGERRVRVDAKGQVARTDFQILEAGEHATLLQAALHTGRTHQIRVHAQSQGHPILGDTKYGGASGPKEVARLCLHASRLVVPIGGDKLDVSAPLEPTMASIWTELKP
ncbi:MAG: RluA family pseudouridine synthase [Gammaproteobacteria bacterium TMED243]|jgi:23S rRNA pseudouridine955/2504/2580 synthase|nr:23S rRNA pseudouridine(955/2504/2580) synthase [Gammaproteobacteria bacterium]RPG33095.1 MAG: RluA family pseudouridine synthase [Gammaproteobacteria bacterium TMED243]|tara:strand:- start:380 stop:1285 length:906 start_codon:yes stop_codon:yes gene_type:complete